MTGKTWCPLPWMSINVRNNGDMRVCCNANVGFDQGLLKKSDGSSYNLGKDDVSDARNSRLLQDIRKSMMKNEFHSSCIRCKQEEDSGMVSRMRRERTLWQHVIDEEKIHKITNNDGGINPDEIPISYMDLRFGNLCNLKCRMCGPTDSNQWYEDSVKLHGNEYNDSGKIVRLIKTQKGRYEPDVSIYNWYENPNFWKNIENRIPDLEMLYIVGGEPLLINQHYDFLQKCVDMGYANKITLEYNSNITNVPKRAYNIWKFFKNVRIGMSIDAVGPLNDYIRNPSNWKKIEENMNRLDLADGNFTLWWTATIQAYNLIHLPEMMIWKIQRNFKRVNNTQHTRPIISPHPLHKPDFLNIRIFPKDSKEWISEYFEKWKISSRSIIHDLYFLTDSQKNNYHKWFGNILDNYDSYMKADDYSKFLEKFWRYTNQLDSFRNESFKEICPITWDLLKGHMFSN